MAKQQPDPTLPDWWQREKQRRQNWLLLFLVTLGVLIAYYYWVSARGRIGTVQGVDFDTRKYIAFVHQDKEGKSTLYAVRDDGSDLRVLTPKDDISNKQDPVWTIDGKSLLYSSNRSDSKVMQIYVLGQGGPTPVDLRHGQTNSIRWSLPMANTPSFSRRARWKTVLLNGNEVDQVLPQPQAGNTPGDGEVPGGFEPRGPFLSAAFASDGVSIAATQAMTAEDMSVAMDGVSANDQVVRVLHPNLRQNAPVDFGKETFISWEPNGNRLATNFTEREVKSPDGKSGLISGIQIWDFSGADGKPKATPLITALPNTIQVKNVAWSPDGKLMAFEVWDSPDENHVTLKGILMAPVQQGGVVQSKAEVQTIFNALPLKADAKGIPSNPHWSPGGAKLLYQMRRPDGGHDLWAVNSDGTNPLNLTEKLGGDNVQPAWAPVKK